MNALLNRSAGAPTDRTTSQQFVLLAIGEETYGIEIGMIHGIIMPQPVTEVPKTPLYVKGVTNLRGKILPVLDMRTRFGLGPVPANKAMHVRFVIVETVNTTAGIIVDAVSEVACLGPDEIDPPSQLLHSEAYACMSGVGKLSSGGSDRLVVILDVDKLLELSDG